MVARIRTKVDDRDIVAFVKEGLSPQAEAQARGAIARGILAEAQEQNRKAIGVVPHHETFVDGRRDAPLESVNPDGIIVFEFNLLLDIFAWVGEQLVLHSPVLSGRYRNSHLFLADGVPIDPGGAVPPAEEYVFVNSTVYARKIERGDSDQAPDGVYEGVAALAAERFGNMARVRFTYRSLLSPYVALGGRKGGKTASPEKRAAHNRETASRQPAIIIVPR